VGFSGGGGRVGCGNIRIAIDGRPAVGEPGMRRLRPRASITIDEAVSILLGRSTGPIDFQPMDDSEEAEANCPVFDLWEALEDELDQDVAIAQANAYLCEINDEINKGEQSVLKVDRALSNAAYTYITRHSFKEWVERRASVSAGAADAETPSATSAAPTAVITKRAHGTKLLDRKDAIVAEIVRRGLNPKALPKWPSGKAGLKLTIRDALQASPLFKGSTKLFDKAWEGLFNKDDERLAYEE
jgi:hypothetical protein